MNNVLEKKSLVSEILIELSKYDNIPSSGFLAGGAVANTILNMVWGGNYPINDLDIFIEDKGYDSPSSNAPVRTNALTIEGDGYMVTKIAYDTNTTYQIVKVERDGYLNNIYIRKNTSLSSPKTDYGYILNGFDFNCCQVGIDLTTNTIVYTEEFKSFLENKQLEVTAIYTPAHTAIRLFKKMDELNCFCNVDSCMELLSQPLIVENIVRMSRRSFGIYFGSKYKDMYMKYYSKLKEYFSLIKYFDHKKSTWGYRSNPNDVSIPESVKWLNPKYTIPTEVLGNWAKFNDIIWSLTPKKYDKKNELIFGILEQLSFNPLTFMGAYNLTKNEINKKQKFKSELILKNSHFSKMLCLTNNQYHNCDFDLSHIQYIEKMVDSERWLLYIIFKFRMNAQETYNFVKSINKLFNSDGEWVSPLLQKSLLSRNILIKPTYENMKQELDKEKEKYSTNIIEPIPFDDLNLPYDIKIKEITSELDMRWAGNKLKNCINNDAQNYKLKIKTGKTKIFVIITPNNMSALEIELEDNQLMFKIIQILSYCNKQTTEYHKTIGNLLVNKINKKRFIDGYDKKIKSFGDIELLNRGFLISLKDESSENNTSSLFLNALDNHYPTPIEEVPEVEQDMIGEYRDAEVVVDLPTVEYRAPIININRPF